jgi:hypothetical protein
MSNYKAIQQGVKELLANNIVIEEKKAERQKGNGNELF